LTAGTRGRTQAAVMQNIQAHPYADFVHNVQKPGRYLGGENGEIRGDWNGADCRMCLAFPDVYEVGMSHLGFKILYSAINSRPGLIAERCYAPWHDMEETLRQRDEPLRSLETWHALREFDVVGFSLQFELTFTNVLQMLELGGIPLRSADRTDADPLVIAGGPTATHPEPLSAFIDIFLIGDGEQRTPEVMEAWATMRKQGVPRAEAIGRLAELGGLYAPSLYMTEVDADSGLLRVARATDGAPLPVQRNMLPSISDYPFPTDGPVATTETVFDRVAVEIARGCTEGCRFCQAGMIYRPVRERDPEEVVDVLRAAIDDNGYDSASLTSLSTADYSAISPLIAKVTDQLKNKRAKLSVSSLRAYGLDPDVLDKLKEGGAKGLTFAPEAGTQRMRDVINKNVTEEQLLETAERVFSRGWDRMKLYFILGLPTEEDEDVLGIVETGLRALEVGRRHMGKRAKVTVSVSTHVPKPHTPFQWCAMDAHSEVQRKQRLLREAARGTGLTLRMHDSAGSWVEGVLARGDRTLCDVVEGAYRRGARFDSWDEQLKLDAWEGAFAEAGIEPANFLGTLPTTAQLPWQHIDVGLDDGFLAREYRKSLRSRLSPPCGKAVGTFVHHTNLETHEADARKLVCYNCGVACDMQAMRQERGDFLVKLGARKPRPVEAPAATAPVPKKKKGRRKPPVRPDQGTPVRVRLSYQKVGRAAFTSHLDMLRLLPRLFRRLELPLYYSLGFNPKPVMTFGPALSLGIASLGEYVDIKLCEDTPLDLQALPAQLTEASIDGIRFTHAVALQADDAKLGKLIDTAVYVAGLPAAALEHCGVADVEALTARIEARRDQQLQVRREIDGIGKNVNVGDYLLDVRVGEGAQVLADGGWAGELLPVTIRLRITGGGTAKVSEALDALLDSRGVPARFVRVGLYTEREDGLLRPVEVSAHRLATAATTSTASGAASASPPNQA